MLERSKIELLSPAKNKECAIAAILAGADAVYMGAQAFGARQNAGNSYEDIRDVCNFAHSYGARVYIALNTIFTDDELQIARDTAFKVYRCGADAIIIQDMGLLMGELPPLEIHASTQCHIADLKKAQFLENAGFSTLVLARELSLKEISEISRHTSARIESFIHGALCVSYSGQCYLSYAIGGRSGNRGECAQACRLKYELLNREHETLLPPAHYLSLKDLNRSNSIGEMLDAGVSSFKIEGRLKDVDYVKNITSHYRKILDVEIEKRKLSRSSFGTSFSAFLPNPNKSFNREFTEYFLHSTEEKIGSFKTPKSKGEFVGEVIFASGNIFQTKGLPLHNGDGIFVENPNNTSFGTLIQKVENDKIIPSADCPQILKGAKIWRNKDVKFESEISNAQKRTMPLELSFSESENDYVFDFFHPETKLNFQYKQAKSECEQAQNFERAKALISENISKLGDTKFHPKTFNFNAASAPFLKLSQINNIRRLCAEKLEELIRGTHTKNICAQRDIKTSKGSNTFISTDFKANVLNEKAKNFYKKEGVEISEMALESGINCKEKELMHTKHCILRELNMCKKKNKLPENFKEPLKLKTDKICLDIKFNCTSCSMSISLARAYSG